MEILLIFVMSTNGSSFPVQHILEVNLVVLEINIGDQLIFVSYPLKHPLMIVHEEVVSALIVYFVLVVFLLKIDRLIHNQEYLHRILEFHNRELSFFYRVFFVILIVVDYAT